MRYSPEFRPGPTSSSSDAAPGVDGRLLAEGRTYTGVDISPAMVELARGNVPAGQFIARDLATLDLPESSFDAVVSLYVTGHLPADEHAPLVRRAWRWLRSGGVFCSSFPLGAGEDVEGDFIGVPMFFGGIGPDATKEALAEAGFAIELERGLTDPMALQGGFLWAIARKPA